MNDIENTFNWTFTEIQNIFHLKSKIEGPRINHLGSFADSAWIGAGDSSHLPTVTAPLVVALG